MVLDWAKERLLDQLMAQIITTSLRWTREHLIMREYGHSSVFGEKSVIELTDEQVRLISLSQLYDVIQTAVASYCGEDDDGKKKIPDNVLSYPGKMLKWYNDWKDKNRTKPVASSTDKSSSKSKQKASVVFSDDESDAQAMSAFFSARRKRQEQETAGG